MFVACCILHNMMMDEMQCKDIQREDVQRIGHGCQMPNDDMWLVGPTELSAAESKGRNKQEREQMSIQLHCMRNILADNICA